MVSIMLPRFNDPILSGTGFRHFRTSSIYSQLKSFSSSEIAAMIEGLVRHDTEMRVEKNFVDSHGQSEVAFAFCHLLGTVRLMPRLKRIKYERLYLLAKGTADDYLNLSGTFARPIRWDLMEQQYDEMVHFFSALLSDAFVEEEPRSE